MAKCSRKGNISDLPQNIIEKILVKLPIRDAVKTSILSAKWRYQWTTMTQLVFDEKPRGDGSDAAEKKLVNFVTQSLLLHDGPIQKFKVCTSYLRRSTDIDQWLRVLSRSDIEELSLGEKWTNVNGLRAPSHIFACKQLTKLKLCGFVVKPPLKFQGFPCLKYLNLTDCTVALHVIENLLSGCPLLEKFKFINAQNLALTVRAPNLKHLIVVGDFKDVYLEHTPLLGFFSVELHNDKVIPHSFIDIKDREKVWEDNFRMRVPVTYDYLKVIDLGYMNFEEMNALLYVLDWILQSPNLQELRIAEAGSCAHYKAAGLDFWEKHCPTNFTFKHLKVVQMSEVSKDNDMQFLKFVLERSPVLELMRISPAYKQIHMVNKVLRLGRAFPNVEIKFFDF